MQNRSTPPAPPAAYWVCQVGGWGAFFLFLLFVIFTTGKGSVAFSWNVVGGYLLLSICGILLTHAFRGHILRHNWLDLPMAKLLPRIFSVNLGLAVLLVAIVWTYFIFLPPPNYISWKNFGVAVAAAVGYTFNDFVILTLWSSIYLGTGFVKRQRRMEIERYQAETALAEAELRGLKSQLNPHFFFNSLNSLRALILEDPARAQEAITQLAAILRYHLQSGDRSLVPLADELDTVEHYLALELIRFEDRLTIQRAIDPASLPCLVPPLALQTLVENAVKYGVSREAGAAVIALYAHRDDNHLEISLRNTGALRSSSSSQSTGLGLTNLRTRLRLLFADRATLDLHEPEPGWVEARLIIPVTGT
ncbi:MAG: histidine kinase [Chthoniobacterales bacterium]